MKKSTNSTISLKPQLPAANLESWITGAGQSSPEPEPATPKPRRKPASKPAGQPASLQADKPAGKPVEAGAVATRMLSVRIPASLHQELRVHAVSHGKQIQDIVASLLLSYEQASRPAGQPAGLLTSGEATRMLSVRIPGDLHHRLRVQAVSESRQIQDIVIDLLRGYLAESGPK